MKWPDRLRTAWPMSAVLAIATLLALLGLTNHGFWDDEANTALFARNLLFQSKLSGWDGANLVGYSNGAELDARLLNVYMPPVQFYLAALGLKFFGLTTFGGRIPFVVFGLLSLPVLAKATRWHFDSKVPHWLPPLLLALSPAYLLYIRQCRYYAPAIFLTVVVFAAQCHPKRSRTAVVLTYLAGSIGMATLMLTNYLAAMALAATLPGCLLLKRYRARTHLWYLGAVYTALLFATVWVVATANPLNNQVLPPGPLPKGLRLLLLAFWHLTGLFRFEFFAISVPMTLVALHWLNRKDQPSPLIREGFVLCLLLVVYSLAIVAISPQTVRGTRGVANMRYVVGVFPLAAMATSCALVALWEDRRRWSRGLTVGLAALLIGSNLFTSAFAGWAHPRSTIVAYVIDCLQSYKTGNELMVDYLRSLPQGKVVEFIPKFMTYPAMFYVPEHRYCCQLSDNHPAVAEHGDELPEYLYPNRVPADYVLVGNRSDPNDFLREHPGEYRVVATLGTDCRDKSRPEIPWHSFGPPKTTLGGCTVLKRVQ